MRPGRTLSNTTFKLHQRFRITENEEHLLFRCFSYGDSSVSIQTRNLQIFASEAFKDSEGHNPNVFLYILITMPPENFSPHYQFGFFFHHRMTKMVA